MTALFLSLVAVRASTLVQAQEAGPSRQAVAVAPADRAYVEWLEGRSMLHQAEVAARAVSGSSTQWGRPYAEPQPRGAVEAASVWVLGYPGSVVTRPGASVLATWADPALWKALQEIGVDLLHTGPVKRSGGIRGREYTPTIDGWFDRISLEVDPALGTEDEYRRMVSVAGDHGGSIAGDLVPLHTGKGADFLLALRAYKDYPGMYTMVSIPEKDWGLLPDLTDEWATAPVSRNDVETLTASGYLPGLIDSADAVPNAKELSGWDATGPVMGVDGKVRRWVYLHYFKPGQPTLNWLDPSMAGPRAIAGDVVKTVHDLKARVVRLDAVPFLGIEPRPGTSRAWGYQHPLSVNGTDQLAFLTRKLGGFSFQELNVPLSQLTDFTRNGPDLSYDFITRTQCLHAALTGDAGPLRLAFDHLLKSGVEAVSLVHDLQNHDEFTYQLVELDFRGDDTVEVNGKEVLGRVLRERILREMREKAAGESAPYNLLYRAQKDGIATTTAGFLAAGLGVGDPYHASPELVERIRRAHLLLAHANAMQPGVFSLSGWDLVGALPLPAESVADRMDDG
ncbi:MAG: maltose alpha-D-glucosyltransferase, partial [Isosphaeraceae bacterium]